MIGLLTTTTVITQLLTPQPEPSVLNDTDLQADYWREQAENKTELIEEVAERNAELEQAIEELEKEVDRLGQVHIEDDGRNNTRSSDKYVTSDNGDADSIDNLATTLDVEATFYTAFCSTGCIGVTSTGLDVSSTIYTPEGYRVIAVDPSVIALGSIVKVTLDNGGSFEAKAEDTGGDIQGNRIDILVESTDEAYRLGRQAASVEVIE